MTIIGRIFQDLINPVGFIWAYCIVAAICFFRRKDKCASTAFAAGAILIWIVGSSPLPAYLVHRLEKPYLRPGEPIDTADALLVFGGIGAPMRMETFRIDLGSAADRAITGAELMRQGKARVLVLGGGGMESDQLPTEGGALRDWFVSWKLFTNEVITLDPSRNTRDEVTQTTGLAQKLGWHKIILVTSAAHMKRAEAMFRKAPFTVIPVACDFVGTRFYETRGWKIVPDLDGLLLLRSYLHETIGWLAYRWKDN